MVCMVWYGMVWYGMVWYGMVWYGMVWYGMVWYGMVYILFDIVHIIIESILTKHNELVIRLISQTLIS